MLLIASDPNWMLSTTAQSTAALVAIVVGFVLSRIITMAAERNGLVLREAQLREDVWRLDMEVKRVQEDLDAMDFQWFDEAVLDFILDEAQDPLADPDADFGDLAPSQLKDRMRYLTDAVKLSQERLEASRDELRQLADAKRVISQADKNLALSEHVVKRLWRHVKPRSPYDLQVGMLSAGAPSGPTRSDIYSEWLDERTELVRTRDRQDAELEVVRTAFSQLALPAGLLARGGITFGALMLFGCVLPIFVLAFQPEKLHLWVTLLVFIGFLAALVVASGFVVWVIVTEVSAVKSAQAAVRLISAASEAQGTSGHDAPAAPIVRP